MLQIDAILAQRVQAALRQWVKLFDRNKDSKRARREAAEPNTQADGDAAAKATVKSKRFAAPPAEVANVQLQPTTHYVTLRNSVMFLNPPLPQVGT